MSDIKEIKLPREAINSLFDAVRGSKFVNRHWDQGIDGVVQVTVGDYRYVPDDLPQDTVICVQCGKITHDINAYCDCIFKKLSDTEKLALKSAIERAKYDQLIAEYNKMLDNQESRIESLESRLEAIVSALKGEGK
jgi:hypothetical protein